MPAQSAKEEDKVSSFVERFKENLKAESPQTPMLFGLVLIAVFLLTASLAPSIGTKFGLVSLKKSLQNIFAQGISWVEPENATLSGSVFVGSDANASNGKYLEFSKPGSFQPSAPYYATFYYPWYKNVASDGKYSYWQDNGHTPPSNWFSNFLPDVDPSIFDPGEELYSSGDDSVIYWQLKKMAEAKQEVAISSWWGQNHKTDLAFRHLVNDVMGRSDNPYPNLRWTIYYEKEGFGNPAVSEIVSDLNYIKTNYGLQPSMLKIDGKPVVFVYADATDAAEMASRWSQARAQTGFYVVLKVYSGYKTDPNQPDSWHQYSPAIRSDSQSSYSFGVSPGFWKDREQVRLPRDITSFRSAVGMMVGSSAMWRLTQTWNEWGEGSSVEPGDQVIQTTSGSATLDPAGAPFKNAYVEVLSSLLPSLERGTGAMLAHNNPNAQVAGVTSDPVLAAVGDIACGMNSTSAACKQMEVSDLIINKINPSAVLALGDLQYEFGEYTNYMYQGDPRIGYDASFGRFKDKTYPTIGNHEYGDSVGSSNMTPDCDILQAGNPSSYACGTFDYFNGKGNLSGQMGERGKGYYAVDVGNWRLYSINSNCQRSGAPSCAAGSPQELWFKADLAAHPNNPKLMILHHPYLSSDTRSFDYYTQLHDIWQDFYQAGGDLALVGHSHFYERFAPMNPDRVPDSEKGIRQFIVGTGGRNVYGFGAIKPNSEVRIGSTFGAMKLTLHQTSYEWQFLDLNGQVLDSGTASSHIQASPSPSPVSSPPPCPVLPTNTGVASTVINVGEAGDYKVWNRIMASDSTNNSYFLQVDDNCGIVVGDQSNMAQNTWSWVDYQNGLESSKVVVHLSAGNHTVKMIGREVPLKVDKLIFTQDMSCVPQGAGGNCLVSAPSPTPVPTPTPLPTPVPSPSPVPLPVPSPTPVPSPSPSPGISTLKLSPTDDTFVQSDNPNNNYGRVTTLQVDGSPVKIIYMKFDLSSLAGKKVSRARLRYKVANQSNGTQNFKNVSNTTWTESGLVYANRPALSGTIASVKGGVLGAWIEVNLTTAVQSKAGQRFAIGIDSSASDALYFYSKEASVDRPTLVVEY